MRHRLIVFLAVGFLAACASVPPSTGRLEIYVNYDSGGTWPTVISARIYDDGTLAIRDGAEQVRRRVSPDDALFRKIREQLDSDGFQKELRVAAATGGSSRPRVRLERGDVIALTALATAPPHLRAVLTDIDALFTRVFGRRYEQVLADRNPG